MTSRTGWFFDQFWSSLFSKLVMGYIKLVTGHDKKLIFLKTGQAGQGLVTKASNSIFNYFCLIF
jgi:hypothetical protein